MENILVAARLKPSNEDENCPESVLKIDEQAKQIYVNSSGLYQFDEVFGSNHNNMHVFKSIILPFISEFISGKNLTIFTYGQTFSGKTHTMQGNSSEFGISQLAISEVFTKLTGIEFSARVSHIEIYNEKARDLNKDYDSDELKLLISDNKLQIKNLSKILVTTASDAIKLYKKGNENRAVSDNGTNKQSSRSHSIFRIELEIKNKGLWVQPELNLVDLAGSEGLETFDKSTQNECRNINQSLLTLKRIVSNLKDKTGKPSYRDSVLTRILENSLNGSSYLVVICCIVSTKKQFSETKSTLNFAQEAKLVKVAPVKQETTNKEGGFGFDEIFFKQISEKDEEILKLKKIIEDLTGSQRGEGLERVTENGSASIAIRGNREYSGLDAERDFGFVEVSRDGDVSSDRLRERVRELHDKVEKLSFEKGLLEDEILRKDEEIHYLSSSLNLNQCQGEILSPSPLISKLIQENKTLKSEHKKLQEKFHIMLNSKSNKPTTNYSMYYNELMWQDSSLSLSTSKLGRSSIPNDSKYTSTEPFVIQNQLISSINKENLLPKLESLTQENERFCKLIEEYSARIEELNKKFEEVKLSNEMLIQENLELAHQIKAKDNEAKTYKMSYLKTPIKFPMPEIPEMANIEKEREEVFEMNKNYEVRLSQIKERNKKRSPQICENCKSSRLNF